MKSLKKPTWDEWVHKISDGASTVEIGRRLGVSRSTASRWSKRVDASIVLAVARAYDADPVEGMMVAGLLRFNDLSGSCRKRVLKEAATRDLIHELCRRAEAPGGL